MVAARKLEPQKQLIEVHLLHKMEGDYPDVPIAEGIDFEGLVQPDREAGEDPFLITLPLGESNQVSRNNRRYVEDVAVNAIHSAIQQWAIDGQLGHTAEDRRAWEFKLPALYWVGSHIDAENVVWGKAYIPRSHMDLREYYRIKMKTNGNVGTSLEGMGLQIWNDETEMWDITELEVHRIDAVSASGVGIPKAGSMPPKITNETKQDIQEATPGEVEVGDFVSWDRDGAMVVGQVNTVFTEGEVEIPYNDDAPKLTATEDNPIARMYVFQPNWEDGGWRRTDWQVIQYVSDLTKIDMLPESKQDNEPALSEGHTDNEDVSLSEVEGDNPMTEKVEKKVPQEKSTADIDEANESELTELEEQIQATRQVHEKEMTRLQAQLDESVREARNLRATLHNVREKLEIDDEANLMEVLEALLKQRDDLHQENTDLLEAAIEKEIDQKVAFEDVRPTVLKRVQAQGVNRKADIEKAVDSVLESDDMQLVLKLARRAAMGPNITTPFAQVGHDDDAHMYLEPKPEEDN